MIATIQVLIKVSYRTYSKKRKPLSNTAKNTLKLLARDILKWKAFVGGLFTGAG